MFRKIREEIDVVFERDPAARSAFELERLWSLLRPAGWLGIMTKRLAREQDFSGWHYKNDPTHVIFFSDLTFEWLASEWETTAVFCGPDVVLLQKPGEIP